VKTLMDYKGYFGYAELDADAGIFHGEVVDLRDVITFQGESVAELRQAFHDSVDDYLSLCEGRGEEPEKSFSGRFITRVTPEIHRLVNLAAHALGVSLNAWVAETLQRAAESIVGDLAQKEATTPRLDERSPGKVSRKDKRPKQLA
jgi:predicted HicB family RNase H-like nuclease